MGTLFFSGIAWGATNKIEVSFDPVRFIVDKVDKTPSGGKFNNNGSPVPSSLIYSGTTYVPIKLIGDMIGKPVAWDGKTKSVLFGDSVVEGDYLTDKAPVDVADKSIVNSEMQLDNQTYKNGLYVNIYYRNKTKQSYNLNGQYKSLNFNYASLDKASDDSSASMVIYGDGKELWSSTAVKGVPVQSATIPVNGVLKLDIEFANISGNSYPAIVNPLLSK
ncbi:NPCBM/NEW2 domain-containing protein [Paenibacillus sp. LS1]|uniref:NPCBM/NEW2 domain-containing protein n=1 Tax=Paenibacillus sp. LS1 TaxID=2992120 RepID=UPI00222F97AE|nr:NPCBM/NEW2 domain-containing protein [Paenibacillus sp. LS1]MCW3791482.1 NPCBM/NEW2 domain-containing protein [Paenibacillus sp. LS1]